MKQFFKITFGTALLCTLFSSKLFAQQAFDRIIFTDSSKVTAVVKSVIPPDIQYSDYNTETQKEGAVHSVSVAQVARIEYGNGRKEYNADWLKTLQSKEQAKLGAILGTYYGIGTPPKTEAKKEPKKESKIEPQTESKSVVEKETNYEHILIAKTNLVDDLQGIYNVGLEYTIGKNFSIEGEIGLVLQNENRSHVLSEYGFSYPFTQTIRTSGLGLGAAIKWYTGYSNRWVDMILNTSGINAAPHGFFISIRDDLRLMSAEQDFAYTTINLPKQTVKSDLFLNSVTLCVGYQQTRIFKILTLETYAGLGLGHRTSPAINITSPSGVETSVVKQYDTPGITGVGGFTIGIDINALKRKD